MWQLLTLAQMRDAVRRELNITPPIDEAIPGAREGDCPTAWPHPSNALINQSVRWAISKINRQTGFIGSNDFITLAIAAQTANYPLQISLQANVPNTATFQINTVRRVSFLATGAVTETLLFPTTMYQLDREERPWASIPPAAPRFYLIEGGTLWLTPAPNVAGTLRLMCGLGLISPQVDTDTLGQLPSDYYPVVIDIVKAHLQANQIEDAVSEAALRVSIPQAEQGIRDIAEWLGGQAETLQPSLIFESHRRAGGSARRRR